MHGNVVLLLGIIATLIVKLLARRLTIITIFALSFVILHDCANKCRSSDEVFYCLNSGLILLIPICARTIFCGASLTYLLTMLLISTKVVFLLDPVRDGGQGLSGRRRGRFNEGTELVTILRLTILNVL